MTVFVLGIVFNERTFNNGKLASLAQNIIVPHFTDNMRQILPNVKALILENGKVLHKHITE